MSAHEDEQLTCLDESDECVGVVEMRCSPGMNARSWPRCELHIERRFASYETSIERYADSDVAPAWFDPSYAGERWNEDD